jgi:hypothetical protein
MGRVPTFPSATSLTRSQCHPSPLATIRCMNADQCGLVREPTSARRSSVAGWNRLSFSLRSLAILVTIAAALLATFAEQIREYCVGPQLPYKVIQSIDDLNEALSAERSIVYCDVQWSVDAVRGRRVFHDLAISWRRRMPDTPVSFYLVDLTERNEVVTEAVDVWGMSDTTGSGELAWIRDGTPRAYTSNTDQHTHAELASIAQKAFELLSVADFPGNPKGSADTDLWYWDETIGPPSSGSTVVRPPADNSDR